MNEKYIFTQIWTNPRPVFKFINDNHYDKYVKLLLVLAGIASYLESTLKKPLLETATVLSVLLPVIFFGGLVGWILFYIFSVLISWTGKWINGKGNTRSILRVLSFAMIPSIVQFFLSLLLIFVYGIEIIDSSLSDTSSFMICVGFINIVLSIWSKVLFVVGISEVQKLSIAKSILNILLPSLFFLAFFFLGYLIFNS